MKKTIKELARKNRIIRYLVLAFIAVYLFITKGLAYLRQHRKVGIIYATVLCLLIYSTSPFLFKAYAAAEGGVAEFFFDISGNNGGDISGNEQGGSGSGSKDSTTDVTSTDKKDDKKDDKKSDGKEEKKDTDKKESDKKDSDKKDKNNQTDKKDKNKQDKDNSKEDKKENKQETNREEDPTPVSYEEIIEEETIRNESVSVVSSGFERVGVYLVGALGSKLIFELEDDSRIAYATCSIQNANLEVNEGVVSWEAKREYYGYIGFEFYDKENNKITEQSLYIMVDANSPKIELSESQGPEEEKYVHISIYETGDVKSGLKEPSVYIDGVLAEDITLNYDVVEENVIGQGVVSELSIDFDIETYGSHDVKIVVQDYGGNITALDRDIVRKYTPVRVKMPAKMTLTIDPYCIAGRGAIYSDSINIENESAYSVKAILKGIDVEIAGIDESTVKGASLYLCTDDGKRFELSDGSNVFAEEYVLGTNNSENSKASMWIEGDIARGSEQMWNPGDLKMVIRFEFSPASLGVDK